MTDLNAKLAAAEAKVAQAEGLALTLALRELDRVKREIRAAAGGHDLNTLY
jgi:hypothetical protein